MYRHNLPSARFYPLPLVIRIDAPFEKLTKTKLNEINEESVLEAFKWGRMKEMAAEFRESPWIRSVVVHETEHAFQHISTTFGIKDFINQTLLYWQLLAGIQIAAREHTKMKLPLKDCVDDEDCPIYIRKPVQRLVNYHKVMEFLLFPTTQPDLLAGSIMTTEGSERFLVEADLGWLENASKSLGLEYLMCRIGNTLELPIPFIPWETGHGATRTPIALTPLMESAAFLMQCAFLHQEGVDIAPFLDAVGGAAYILPHRLSYFSGSTLTGHLLGTNHLEPNLFLGRAMTDLTLMVTDPSSFLDEIERNEEASSFLPPGYFYLHLIETVKKVMDEESYDLHNASVEELASWTERLYEDIAPSIADFQQVHTMPGKLLEICNRFVSEYSEFQERWPFLKSSLSITNNLLIPSVKMREAQPNMLANPANSEQYNRLLELSEPFMLFEFTDFTATFNPENYTRMLSFMLVIQLVDAALYQSRLECPILHWKRTHPLTLAKECSRRDSCHAGDAPQNRPCPEHLRSVIQLFLQLNVS